MNKRLEKSGEGLMVSGPIMIRGGQIISIGGRFKDVLDYAEDQGWNPSRIACLGQNGHTVKGGNINDIDAHLLVIVDIDDGKDIAEVAAAIPKSTLVHLQMDGYDYISMLTVMEGNIAVALFGDDFKGNDFADEITQLLVKTFFTDGLANFADTKTSKLLFIGIDDNGRTIYAMDLDFNDQAKFLEIPNIGKNAMRNAVVGDNILLTCGNGTSTIYGLKSSHIKHFLSGRVKNPNWDKFTLKGQKIEDIAIVDGSKDVVILTLTDGKYRLLPIVVSFGKSGLTFMPSSTDGVEVKHLGGKSFSPIVRANYRANHIAIADRNGSDMIVRFERTDKFGVELEQMLARATSGNLAAHFSR